MRGRRVVDDSGINNGSEGNQRRAAQCCDLYFIIRRSGREVSPPASGPIHRRGAMRFGAGFARSGMTLTAIPIHISVQPYSLSGIDRGGANCGTTGTAACCCEWLQCRATEPLGALRFAGSPPQRQFNVPGTLTLAPAGSTRRTRARDFYCREFFLVHKTAATSARRLEDLDPSEASGNGPTAWISTALSKTLFPHPILLLFA